MEVSFLLKAIPPPKRKVLCTSDPAGSQALDFVDADQASSFALEALCWAVENGILHGVGNGVLDPGGTATRAQAAQLLKNFMESA